MVTRTTSKTESSSFVIISMLVTLIVLGLTIYFSQMLVRSLAYNSKVLSAKNLAANQLTIDLASAKSLVDKYTALGDLAKLIDNSLPTTAAYPQLIAMLESIGGASSVTIKDISQNNQTEGSLTAGTSAGSPSTGTPQIQRLTFRLSVTGTYVNVLKFLSNLQLSARPIKITSVELSGSGHDMQASITGVTYYQDKATLPITSEVIK